LALGLPPEIDFQLECVSPAFLVCLVLVFYFMSKKLLALGVLCLTGCRAFDPALLTPTSSPLLVRLPPLTAEVNTARLHLARVDSQAVAADLRTLFAREVSEVLTSPAGPPQGMAVLTTRRIHYGEGAVYTYLSGLTLTTISLLGFPWGRYRCVVDVQLDILNNRRELVGTYYAQGKVKALQGVYTRNNYAQPARVLYLQCVRQGLEQISLQIPAEQAFLQQQLTP
jgi:hypothetical protein